MKPTEVCISLALAIACAMFFVGFYAGQAHAQRDAKEHYAKAYTDLLDQHLELLKFKELLDDCDLDIEE